MVRKDQVAGPETAAGLRGRVNAILLLWGTLTALVMGMIRAKYAGSALAIDRAWSRYAGSLMWFAIVGMLGVLTFNVVKKQRVVVRALTPRYAGQILWGGLIMLAIVAVVEAALIVGVELEPVQSAISDTDLALYYVFAGSAEELFFRGFVLNLLALVLYVKVPLPKVGDRDGSVTVLTKEVWWILRTYWAPLVISAFMFMYVHWDVYGERPALMVAQFLHGLTWGVGYLYFQDLTPSMVSHTGKNVIWVAKIAVL